MELTNKQKGVVRNVIPAEVLTVVGLGGGSLLLPLEILPLNEPGARIAWALKCTLLPILTLMISIMRVANHRFSSPEDIDGSGLTDGTPQVRVLRAILQNTLEQAVLAVAAYAIWAAALHLLCDHVRGNDFPETTADLKAMATRARFGRGVEITRMGWHHTWCFDRAAPGFRIT